MIGKGKDAPSMEARLKRYCTHLFACLIMKDLCLVRLQVWDWDLNQTLPTLFDFK